MPRLTKRAIDALKPSGREFFAWDDALPGFGVRVQPSGIRTFLVQYRNAHSRTRRLAIGRYGRLTPDQARKLAAEKLAAVAAGRDPAAERADLRGAITVAELVARYELEHLPKKKATSAAEDRRILKKHIIPALGARRVADLRGLTARHPLLKFLGAMPRNLPASPSPRTPLGSSA